MFARSGEPPWRLVRSSVNAHNRWDEMAGRPRESREIQTHSIRCKRRPTMRKNSKKTALPKEGMTIGIDLGDKFSHYYMLDEAAKLIEQGTVLNTESSARKHFAGMPQAVIAIETGQVRTGGGSCWKALGTK
jgi:hypothetical protein